MPNEEERRYRDRYFEDKFETLNSRLDGYDSNQTQRLDRFDLNQTRLFDKCDGININLSALNEAKKEKDRKSIVSGGFSGAIIAAVIWIVGKFTGI